MDAEALSRARSREVGRTVRLLLGAALLIATLASAAPAGAGTLYVRYELTGSTFFVNSPVPFTFPILGSYSDISLTFQSNSGRIESGPVHVGFSVITAPDVTLANGAHLFGGYSGGAVFWSGIANGLLSRGLFNGTGYANFVVSGFFRCTGPCTAFGPGPFGTVHLGNMFHRTRFASLRVDTGTPSDLVGNMPFSWGVIRGRLAVVGTEVERHFVPSAPELEPAVPLLGAATAALAWGVWRRRRGQA
jgi:hypothetical protein